MPQIKASLKRLVARVRKIFRRTPGTPPPPLTHTAHSSSIPPPSLPPQRHPSPAGPGKANPSLRAGSAAPKANGRASTTSPRGGYRSSSARRPSRARSSFGTSSRMPTCPSEGEGGSTQGRPSGSNKGIGVMGSCEGGDKGRRATGDGGEIVQGHWVPLKLYCIESRRLFFEETSGLNWQSTTTHMQDVHLKHRAAIA